MDNAAPSTASSAQDETTELRPRYDRDGLITAIAQDAVTGQILMLAHMNEQALTLTLGTRIAHYWSRSRGQLWKKGETSGNMQSVEDILIDCDQDAVLLKVRVAGDGKSCHTGRTACFYRRIEGSPDAPVLRFADESEA